MTKFDHEVTLEVHSYTPKGTKYRTYYKGKILCKGCYSPEYDSCRALSTLGLTGNVVFLWSGNANYASRIVDIGKGALLTTKETIAKTVHVTKWSAPPRGKTKKRHK